MSQMTIDEALQVALGYHQTGKLPQAEQIYKQILSVVPRHADALHLLGLITGQKGQLAEAAGLIRRAIQAAPDNAAFHCNLGVFLQQQGQLDQAAAAYQRAVHLKSDYPEAHGNLGIVLALKGQTDRAIACYQKAVSLRPTVEILQNLGNAWRTKEQFTKAIGAYQQALNINPNYIEARFNLGICHASIGDLEKASDCYRAVLAIDPGDAGALTGLGRILDAKGDLKQATAFFTRAIQIQPDFLESYCDLANTLHQLGRFDDAAETCRRALERNDRFADAHGALGLALAGQGNLSGAIESYQRAIAIKPDLIEAYCNLANALCERREFESAIDCCKQALTHRPDDADAHGALANAFLGSGQFDQSVASNLHAIKLRQHFPEAFNNLGLAYSGLRQTDQAIESFRRAIELNPELEQAHANLGNALKDNGQITEAIAEYRRALVINPRFLTAADNLLYTLIFDPDANAKWIQLEGRRWDEQQAKPLRRLILPHTNDRDQHRPLRIGYVSPDFSDHPVGRFMLSLIASHDPERFHAFCYSDSRRVDAVATALQQHAHTWRVTLGQSDAELAHTIRDDRIDILVDLTLHMARNRLMVFARKPAPVQATFAGYPGSTGLATVDYRITDPHLDPPGESDGCYSEKSIRLPDTFWCDHLIGEEPPVNDPPFEANGHITFGSLNNFCKVNDSVLSLWADVLKHAADSRLLLLVPEGGARRRVLNDLTSRGVEANRMEFVGHQARREYLECYHRIDIGLDTWPYNGHATSFDSFWMGVPVVTLVGQTVVGRAGLSQLMNLELPELIGKTHEDYVRIAADLARDPNRLHTLRHILRQRMRASPLMNARRFARGMEAAYRSMWHTWCEQPADSAAAVDLQLQQAIQHLEAGRTNEAGQICREILSNHPARHDALRLLARAASAEQKHEQAIAIMEQAIALAPEQSDYHNDLAVILREGREFERAITAAGRAIECRPGNVEARITRGSCLRELGRAGEALAALESAKTLGPELPAVHRELGRTLKGLGRLEDAALAYTRATELRPDDAETHSDLGNIFSELGDHDRAVEAHSQALRIDPDNYHTYNNLGVALLGQGRTDAAIESLRRAIELRADYAPAWTNLGNALKDQGKLSEAIAAQRHAVELQPTDAAAHSNLILSMQYDEQSDLQNVLAECRRFADAHADSLVWLPHSNEADPGRRLRIGYVSPDYRSHPVGHFMLPLIERHDRRQFEIHCFSNVSHADQVTSEFARLADHWHNIQPLNDDDAARLIASQRIDILVDLASHTAHNRLLVFARKPAPVQVSYLAYCGTTGLKAMDYLLSDPFLIPPDRESQFAEQPLRLPRSYWCYRPRQQAPDVSELPALANEEVTFACMNNFAKVSPSILKLWSRLLRLVPHSRLMLHAKQGAHQQRVRDLFSTDGIDPARIGFIETMPYHQYLEQYGSIDISLDPFPFAGGTTTCDSLWMGVPVISLIGETPVSRGGLSVLSNVGLAELTASSPEEYLKIAANLAKDRPRLAQLRRSLRERMRNSPLMDEARFIADLESAYLSTWRAWCGSRTQK